MSATLLQVEQTVRSLIEDVDKANYAVDSRRMRRIIRHHAMVSAAEMGFPHQSIDPFVTLADNDTDYTPSYAAGQPDKVAALKLVSTGNPVTIVSPGHIEILRAQNPVSKGDPWYAAFIEGTGQTYKLRFWPRPHKVDTISAILSEFMAATLTDATVVPLSEIALRAIECESALTAVAVMGPENRQRLKLDEGVIGRLQMMEKDAKVAAAAHKAGLTRAPVGLDYGWWRR